MNADFLSQLLGSPEAAAQAPVDPNQYGKEFFSMSPAARLETLKMQQSSQGGSLDPTGEALMQLLSRRVPRERGPLTSSEQGPQPLPQEQGQDVSVLQRLLDANPYKHVNRTLGQR